MTGERLKAVEDRDSTPSLAIMASLSPQESLWYEQSVNAGAYLGAIAYGAHPQPRS